MPDTNEWPTIRFSRSSRRHRVGKAHARFVMETAVPFVVPGRSGQDERYVWIGFDDRSVELEVGAVRYADCLMVIHVMPRALRGGGR